VEFDDPLSDAIKETGAALADDGKAAQEVPSDPRRTNETRSGLSSTSFALRPD